MNKKSEKSIKPDIYSHFTLNPSAKEDDIIKLGKITIRQYQSIQSAVANEIPIFLRWIEQIQNVISTQKPVSDRRIMLDINKESQERIAVILLSMIRQFSPDILYMSVIYYPDETEDLKQDNKHFYQLVEHKVYEETQQMKVMNISRFNPAVYNDKKYQEGKLDTSKMSILQHIAAKNIYTPLIIEMNSKKQKVLSKLFLNYKGKGELYNYDKRLIERYPIGTIIFPFAITNRVKYIFEVKFKAEKGQDLTSIFVVQFLKHLRNTFDNIITQSYAVMTCKGKEVLDQLKGKKDLTEIKHLKKAIIFLDIFEYSKLSIYIKDKDKSYQENEEIKFKFLNIFNLVVSEIVGKFDCARIDKIVGDMHMIEMNEDESIEDEKDREADLAKKAFLLSWNINLVLRSLNKKAKEIFEERDINILDPDIYDQLIKKNKDKSLKLKLMYYPKPEDGKEKFIYLGMKEFVYYYYICKKFGIEGLQVRIGFNIGEVAEIFLGGTRIDHTVIGKHVDLAARMEHLGKKNVLKFPARIYSLFDKPFKVFVIRQIIDDSKLSNRDITLKMVFQTKREYPKGYEKEGLATVEFFMEIGYAYYEAEKTYEKLETLFEQTMPDNMYKLVDDYVEKHKDVLIESTKKSNPDKFGPLPDNDVVAYILTHKSMRIQIQTKIEERLKKKITRIIQYVKGEYDIYHIVRTLVLNRSYELYKKYFPSDELLSEHRKRDYFTERLSERISNNMNFKNVDKDDLDRIVEDIYIKITGKPD